MERKDNNNTKDKDEIKITKSSKTESTSDSEGESSSNNSPTQISHSDLEESIILISKGDVMTDKDSIGDDKTIEIIDNNLHENKVSNTENNLSIEISNKSEKNYISNLNVHQNVSSTIEVKGTETFEQEKSRNVPPASHVDRDELLSSQSEKSFVNIVTHDKKVINDQKNSNKEDGDVGKNREDNTNLENNQVKQISFKEKGIMETDVSNILTNKKQAGYAEHRKDLSELFDDDNSIQFPDVKNFPKKDDEYSFRMRKTSSEFEDKRYVETTLLDNNKKTDELRNERITRKSFPESQYTDDKLRGERNLRGERKSFPESQHIEDDPRNERNLRSEKLFFPASEDEPRYERNLRGERVSFPESQYTEVEPRSERNLRSEKLFFPESEDEPRYERSSRDERKNFQESQYIGVELRNERSLRGERKLFPESQDESRNERSLRDERKAFSGSQYTEDVEFRSERIVRNERKSFPESQHSEDDPRSERILRSERKSFPESQHIEDEHRNERNLRSERIFFPESQYTEDKPSYERNLRGERTSFPESQYTEGEPRNERSLRDERKSFPESQYIDVEPRNERNLRSERIFFPESEDEPRYERSLRDERKTFQESQYTGVELRNERSLRGERKLFTESQYIEDEPQDGRSLRDERKAFSGSQYIGVELRNERSLRDEGKLFPESQDEFRNGRGLRDERKTFSGSQYIEDKPRGERKSTPESQYTEYESRYGIIDERKSFTGSQYTEDELRNERNLRGERKSFPESKHIEDESRNRNLRGERKSIPESQYTKDEPRNERDERKQLPEYQNTESTFSEPRNERNVKNERQSYKKSQYIEDEPRNERNSRGERKSIPESQYIEDESRIEKNLRDERKLIPESQHFEDESRIERDLRGERKSIPESQHIEDESRIERKLRGERKSIPESQHIEDESGIERKLRGERKSIPESQHIEDESRIERNLRGERKSIPESQYTESEPRNEKDERKLLPESQNTESTFGEPRIERNVKNERQSYESRIEKNLRGERKSIPESQHIERNLRGERKSIPESQYTENEPRNERDERKPLPESQNTESTFRNERNVKNERQSYTESQYTENTESTLDYKKKLRGYSHIHTEDFDDKEEKSSTNLKNLSSTLGKSKEDGSTDVKSGHDARSQKKSNMTEEEFDQFLKTPIQDPKNKRKSKMTDEELDDDDVDYDDGTENESDDAYSNRSYNRQESPDPYSNQRNSQSSSIGYRDSKGYNRQESPDPYSNQRNSQSSSIGYRDNKGYNRQESPDPYSNQRNSQSSSIGYRDNKGYDRQESPDSYSNQRNSQIDYRDNKGYDRQESPDSYSNQRNSHGSFGYGYNPDSYSNQRNSQGSSKSYNHQESPDPYSNQRNSQGSSRYGSKNPFHPLADNDSEPHYTGPNDEIDRYPKQNNQSSTRYDSYDNKNPLVDNAKERGSNNNYGTPGSGFVKSVFNRIIPGSNYKSNEIKFIFHVHLPKGIENLGKPMIMGNVKELGSWKPIIKLYQPFPMNPTYWQSEQVTIPLSNIEIRYKYAIHIVSKWFVKEEKIVYEGNSPQEDRILNIGRNDQFDIWKNNYQLDKRFLIYDIQDFAFLDYIYNSVKGDDLKDMVKTYQHLLTLHKDHMVRATNLDFIIRRIDDKSKERRIFLCLLLGYFIQRQGLFYELPTKFPSGLLLGLDDYRQGSLPSGTKDQMYTAITTLVQHNAFQMKFEWLIIFAIATEVDPNYTFIDRLKALKYPNDNVLAKFIQGVEIIKPYIEGINTDSYVKIAKWLIQSCQNMESLFKMWGDILWHNHAIDKTISRYFIERTRENISHCDAVTLEYQFKKLPVNFRDDVSEVFRYHALFLLESPNRKWTKEEINSIKKLLHNDSIRWSKDQFIQSLEFISQSNTLELLNIFPEILDDWFRSEFTDKEKKVPKICIRWLENVLIKLNTSTNTSTNSKKSLNESNFVFLVFIQLRNIYPLLGHRKNIWQNLTDTAINRVKACSESRIFGATRFLAKIEEQEIRILFLEMVKELLNKSCQQINEQLINKIFEICDCKGSTLEVPNSMSEDILYYIMTRLQNQLSASDPEEYHLNILKASKFWITIFRATGNVAKLHTNPTVQRVKKSINELGGLLLEKTIDLNLLQQLLGYPDDKLFQHFDAVVAKRKALGDVIVSRDEITVLRKICTNYQRQLDILYKFYSGFCSAPQVTDVNDYIQDVKKHNQNSSKVKLKHVMTSDYWAFHENTIESANRCYRYSQSQTFRNIFDACIKEDNAATKVDHVAQKLIPAVFERYNTICKQFKDWEKLKCSDASLFWKDVTDVNAELILIEGYKQYKSQKFVQTINHLSQIPHWIERLEKLEKVVEIFEVSHDEDDWLSKSIRILKDDSMKLSQLNNFFDYLDRNLSKINQSCWKLIKELSNAEEFMAFLKEIAEHDIKNLINSVDDHSDEKLIQEDTVSSLIQVKQFLLPLMNKKKKMEDIPNFLTALQGVVDMNSTLGEKIALCSSSNMALRNMYKNISNRGEVTKERIKNAVLNGTYTFARDVKEDKCVVSLTYLSRDRDTEPATPSTKESSKTNMMIYNMNEILDLRGRALLIAKPKMSENDDLLKDEEMSKNVMDEFVLQVDIAQEIVSTVSMLMQMGHFDYRVFKEELQGADKMKDYFKYLKEKLQKWQNVVDRAQEKCYYLTFFPARHILAFYDYFTSEKLDERNEEECKTLIRFVNSKAQLPSHEDIQGISRKSKDYLMILCEIGAELERIFKNIPKQSRNLKIAEQRVNSDVVKKGKLFVAACTDKTRVPNIIMSLYANHGYYPEPWQLLICTSSTTMEELTIFIKRSFFASNNGYENHLFCIANLELLDFELQYDLVNQIRSLRDQKKDYLLALICYREAAMHHHILDQFSLDVHATNGLNTEAMRGIYRELCQNVIRVSSDLSGQGKTEWIKEDSFHKKKFTRSFLISDGMEFGRLVRQFKECKLRPVESLHINIVSSDYAVDVNMFLFELLTLGIVSTNVDIACLPSSETPTNIYIEVASTTEQHLLNSLPMAGYLLFKHLTWNVKDLIVSQEINSPIQVVCNYLNLLDRNEIDTEEILFRTDKAIKEPLPTERCQNLIGRYFFNKDTKDISSFRFVEIFVNVLADQLVRLSSSQFFTVDNLKLMIKETNIRNLILKTLIEVSKDFATRSIKTKEAQLESVAAIADEENARLGTIVQWDDSNHLIVFFNSQAPDTISSLYRDRTKVPDNVKILLKSQIIGDQTKWELDDYNSMSADALLLKLECLARSSTEKLKLPEYALSGDNLIKMALILLRARANIPVIVCGEAGCGKTSLIAYLALMVEVQFQALNLHAGINEQTIMMFMDDALKKAEEGEIWLFFDEINTCNHIGLLADLISHRMLNGKLIHPNIRLFSACNPYRLRTKAQSEAGLATKVKKYEEQSKLVYQVRPLPDQILDYVWDYGILKPQDEYKYIQIMVEKELKKLAHPVFPELLYASQKFIRKVEEPYSVSLRDVKRAITLVKFFNQSLDSRPAYKRDKRGFKYQYPPSGNPTPLTRSYVLALSLCYHSRLYDQNLRRKYRREMGQILQKHKAYIGEDMFARIIREEQEDYINRMQCPPNTAKNEALLENVLVMIVCILTRIPLFLIGAPGSSKSLAIRLISSNLRGHDSSDKYFRKLPQIYLIPHQGSSSSTSDGIIKVFDKAKKYQETTSKQFPVISVVLLDEVGLAETSPFNPLKVLHSLLEPSYPATGPIVSVIGISNWRLDNSKSSRALLVQRPQFDLEDLIDTAERLLNTKVNLPGQRGALEPLAKAYSDYEKRGQALPNFHGLRDYYALVKRLSLDEMNPENIQMALARNFGGTENNKDLYEKYFGDVLKMFNEHKPWTYKPISIERLINSNLDDSDARHLMVIGKSESIVNLLTYQLRKRNLDPVVILGSQFPEDREDYSYSVLRRIMMCVEDGRPLILTDLEMIYGSLYDLWNQNYIVVGSKDNIKYFTRVALGAYANPMLYVSPKFKCILVMDEKKLAKADPPLLNRFEKQKMSINDIINDRQQLLVDNLTDWARRMSTFVGVNNQVTQLRNKFTQKDLFIGFDKDESIPSLVIDITKNNPDVNDDDEILEKCKECLIATASSDGIVRAERSALERDEVNRWKHVYFNEQHHDSLYDYFSNQGLLADSNGHLVIINTFSNINTDVKSCLQELASCQVDKLSTFKTEAQLSNRVKHFWLESTDRMLVLQCDVTTVNAGCIKLAKYIIEQFRSQFIKKKDQTEPMKHACIILHIHRDQESSLASFNFMCGWKQMTIETLSRNDIPISSLLDGSLSDIIYSTYSFEKILLQELLWCLLCMKYPSSNKSINHIKMLNEKILEYPKFIKCLESRIIELIKEKSTSDWQYKVASNKQNLYPYSSFSAALQAHIRTLVRKPIAQILCALERLSATKTFFQISDRKENDEGLIEFWKQIFMDKKIVKIEDMTEPKPDVYNMPAGSLYDLEFPFSLYFMKQIDSFKRYYEDEIALLKQDDERIDNTTNELYDWEIEEHLKAFKDNILTSIPQLKDSPLERVPELYFNDFVTVIATNDSGSKDKKMLATILKLLIGSENVYQPIFLHSYWWKNANEVLAQLQLAQMNPIIIQKVAVQGNEIVGGSLEKYIVKETTKIMFQRICGSAVSAYLLDKWQHDVTKILSLSNKITRAKNLPALQLLRIVNDLVTTKTIPLDSIIEIVQLGSNSDEVLSEKFVSTVLDKLDKLEQSEKNLIPRRSFIMRCIALIPIESDVRISLYERLFSREPFPLMGAIIERIFLEEDDDENEESIFITMITNPRKALRSTRLNTINNCLKEDLDTNMATLCCDVIEQTFSANFDLVDLTQFLGFAFEALYGQGRPALQIITSIALLKGFVHRFWDSFLQEDKNSPIAYNEMEEGDFDSEELVNQINNSMTFANPLIHSLKMYFLRNLRQRDFSIDDVRQFCDAQKRILTWLETLNWEDTNENRLSINPYCTLPEYNEAENGFMSYYSFNNKGPFQSFIQNVKNNTTLTAKISLIGLFFVRLHTLRASREWRHTETQSSEFLTRELAGMNLPNLYKITATKILSNKHPLLQINNSEISNTDLFLKSVIAHIISLHASVEPNSSQLAMYLHNLQGCQNLFILGCVSDVQSVVLNAVAAEEKSNTNKLTRYVCKCGYMYFVAGCGNVYVTSKCPQCGNTIGGHEYNKPAEGNTRLDAQPVANVAVNDQAGYIIEPVNLELHHSVRSLPPASYRILHLIAHTLIGASSQNSLPFIRKHGQDVKDAEKYCMEHIRGDWEVLKNNLNCSDENLALMFHSLISLMTEKPPFPNQQTTTSAERENWEKEFHKNYIAPQIKNITQTAIDYRMKLNTALTKNQKSNLIEGEINQTLVMDKQYRSENLPSLWRTIGIISFDSFRAYYMSDLARANDYPFLSVFFKYSKQLELLKHLLPIVKFVQILNSKLGYQLTRQKANDMTFRQFIEKESNDGENREIFESLKNAFEEFKLGWEKVLPVVGRYQCHTLPDQEKPKMNYGLPVVFGLMEPKDSGVYLCAMLDHLVSIQNNFLEEVISIPPGTCRSLRFLDEPIFDIEQTVSTSKTKLDTPNGYCLQSIRLDLVRSGNIINFEWDDEILAYSQRNLAVARGEDITYDLAKIEAELANILVFEKVRLETQPETQLYLEPFPYHMELFQGCMRILSDIKNLITQEPIPIEKKSLLGASGISSPFMQSQYASETILDDASEILSSLEILLCFVKRTSVGDGDISIKDYVSQWMRLSSLNEHAGFSRILKVDLRLKHLVALYEFVEEQVANLKIRYIDDKYKAPLSADMEASILQSVGFADQQATEKELIPPSAFALALKRYMLRFLTLENQKEQKEMEPLYIYLQDSSLNFWPSTVSEKLIDELFPDNLIVANTYNAYEFTMKRIEQTMKMKKQANVIRNQTTNQSINPINNSSINQTSQRPTTTKFSQKKVVKKLNRYDAM